MGVFCKAWFSHLWLLHLQRDRKCSMLLFVFLSQCTTWERALFYALSLKDHTMSHVQASCIIIFCSFLTIHILQMKRFRYFCQSAMESIENTCFVQASCIIFCSFLTICILQTRFSTCSDSAMESIESIDVAMNFAETSAGSAESLESISRKCGDHGKQHWCI